MKKQVQVNEEIKEEKFWSQYAENFQELNNYVVGKESMEIFLNEVGDLKNLGNTLEIACGNGTYTKILSKNATQILATDFSKEMVNVSKNILKDFKNVEIRQEDALNLNIEDNTFDTVFLANFLHIVKDCSILLREINRVLKPGGRIIALDVTMYTMTFFNKVAMIYRLMKTYGKPSEKAEKGNLNPRYVEELLLKNNFKVENIKVLGKKSKAILTKAIKV